MNRSTSGSSFAKLRAVALHQAAGHHQALAGIGLLEAGQVQDGVHRLLAGRLDEAAGVDQQEIGGLRLTRHLPARPGEPPQHDFRVHQVLGAAQTDGKDGFGFLMPGFGSGFRVLGFEVFSAFMSTGVGWALPTIIDNRSY